MAITNWRLAGLARGHSQGQSDVVQDTLRHDGHRVLREGPRHQLRPGTISCATICRKRACCRTYYRRFLADREDDPTGYKTLKAVLRRDDMDKFQKEWEAYVLKLKFPNQIAIELAACMSLTRWPSWRYVQCGIRMAFSQPTQWPQVAAW